MYKLLQSLTLYCKLIISLWRKTLIQIRIMEETFLWILINIMNFYTNSREKGLLVIQRKRWMEILLNSQTPPSTMSAANLKHHINFPLIQTIFSIPTSLSTLCHLEAPIYFTLSKADESHNASWKFLLFFHLQAHQ